MTPTSQLPRVSGRWNRRTFLATALAATAGARVTAQAPAAQHGVPGPDAARLVEARAGTLPRSGHRGAGSSLPPLHHLQHVYQTAAHRHVVGRRSRLERRRPVSRLERHPEQPAAAMDRGRRAGDDVQESSRVQQREHVRLPGPAALVRARRAACGAVRTERNRDDDRGALPGEAPELAE